MYVRRSCLSTMAVAHMRSGRKEQRDMIREPCGGCMKPPTPSFSTFPLAPSKTLPAFDFSPPPSIFFPFVFCLRQPVLRDDNDPMAAARMIGLPLRRRPTRHDSSIRILPAAAALPLSNPTSCTHTFRLLSCSSLHRPSPCIRRRLFACPSCVIGTSCPPTLSFCNNQRKA